MRSDQIFLMIAFIICSHNPSSNCSSVSRRASYAIGGRVSQMHHIRVASKHQLVLTPCRQFQRRIKIGIKNNYWMLVSDCCWERGRSINNWHVEILRVSAKALMLPSNRRNASRAFFPRCSGLRLHEHSQNRHTSTYENGPARSPVE